MMPPINKSPIQKREKIIPGPGVNISQTAGGTLISLANYGVPVTGTLTTAVSSSGICLEMYPEWADRQYRLLERCIYKATGDTYYTIYECNDNSATTTDIPNLGGKWTKKTIDAPEWVSTTNYSASGTCMYGLPYQEYIYTSLVANNINNIPSSSPTKWSRGNGVIFGIRKWPPEPGIVIPFKEFLLVDQRYDTSTHLFQFLYYAHTWSKLGQLLDDSPSSYITWCTAYSCSE